MRKLVTVQTIRSISPIEGADRIVAAKINGWTVVVGKDEFAVGDKVAYFEIDSFLPGSNPAFTAFMERGKKTVAVDGVDVEGHVLKTAKLRGVISQGLVLSLGKLGYTVGHIDELSVGDDITEALGVFKYEPPLPTGTNIVGPFDSRFAPKTDAVRLQNLTDQWELIQGVAWTPTLKVDGTSQTFVNDAGKMRVFGRNWELASDAAGMKIAEASGILSEIEEGMAVQAELVGPGVQANKLKLSAQELIVFAVWKNGEKLPREAWPTVAIEHATPVLGDEFLPQNFSTPDDLISFVDGLNSQLTKNVKDEGVVFHPVHPNSVPEELSSVLDRNNNFKVISNSWLVKHKE